MTPDERARLIAMTTSAKAGDITGAVAMLRDWATDNLDDAAVIDVVRAIDRSAGDKRPTVSRMASDALETIAAFARHRGALVALWQQAKAAKLPRATTALVPPSEMSTDTAEGTALRLLARRDPDGLRAELARAKTPRARELIGAIHGEAPRDDVDAAIVVAAVVNAIAHDDDVVRFAAIDAAAVAADRAACDLTPHVDGLIAALSDASRPDYAPGSGMWQTRGIAFSAQRALGSAVRWNASNAAAIAALRPLLDARAKLPGQQAAGAIVAGSWRRGEWMVVDELLASPKPGVREGAVAALIPFDDETIEVPARLAPRIAALRRDPVAAIVKLAARVKVASGGDAGTADPRVLAEGLRSDRAADRQRALDLLKPIIGDPGVVEAITPWLVDALGTEHREDVLRLIGRCADLDLSRWAPLLAGVLLDGDWTTARPDAARLLARIDTSKRAWHALVNRR